MGRFIKTVRKDHKHEILPNANDYGAGTIYECFCGDRWIVYTIDRASFLPKKNFWMEYINNDN